MSPELMRALCAAGARLMHDSDQHEIVAFREGALEKFLEKRDLAALHRYAVLGGEAEAVGLALSANAIQFLLREQRTSQVYASCRTLEDVDEALRRRRQATAMGRNTGAIQAAITSWPPRSVP